MLIIFACIHRTSGKCISRQEQWIFTILTIKVSNCTMRGDSIGFRWTHVLRSVNTKLPKNVNWIENGCYFVFQPCATHHIGHFVESINHALLKLRYPSFYPPLTDLYIPKFFSDEFEWSKSYLQLVLSLFPDNLKPALHLGSSFSAYPAVCFRSAVSLWMNTNLGVGGSRAIPHGWSLVCWLFPSWFCESNCVAVR